MMGVCAMQRQDLRRNHANAALAISVEFPFSATAGKDLRFQH